MQLAPEPAKSIRITIRLVLPTTVPSSLARNQHIEPAANDAGFYTQRYLLAFALVALSIVVFFLLPAKQQADVVVALPPSTPVVVPPFTAEKTTPVSMTITPQLPTPVIPKSAALLSRVSDETHTSVEIDRRLTRAQLTSGMRGREPLDKLTSIIGANSQGKRLYYFTELKNMRGTTVSHNWLREGVVMLSVKFKIGSNRWRIFSNTYLRPKLAGRWRVETIDNGTGKVMGRKDFIYQK